MNHKSVQDKHDAPPSSAVHALASLVADPSVFGRRGLAKGAVVQKPEFWDQYDDSTLIYDAVWQPRRRKVKIFFPKLFGFQSKLERVHWNIDGRAVPSPRLVRYRVYDTLSLPCPEPPTSMTMTLGDSKFEVPFNLAEPARFAGRRVLYTQVKDDKISWITDWIRAHQRIHGTDAVLIANNGSQTYSSEDLRQAIAQIPGLLVADVLDVPLPYGPRPGTCNKIGLLSFQQPTLLNLVRDRWFTQAFGVLLCDVDELVSSQDNTSIYEATANSLTKFISFGGEWRYQQGDREETTHAKHVLTRENAIRCPNKYCIVPDSVIGRLSWSVHSIDAINRRLVPKSRKFGFYHCRSISTTWKNSRDSPPANELHIDKQTAAFMAKAFPGKAEE